MRKADMAANGLVRFSAVCGRMRGARLESRYARALGLMAFSAGGSLAHVAFHYGGAVESPLIVSGVYRLSAAVGLLALAAALFRRLLLDWSVIRIVMGRACAWTLGLAGLSYFDFAFYTLSLRFIDISVAAILSCLGTAFDDATFGANIARAAAAVRVDGRAGVGVLR